MQAIRHVIFFSPSFSTIVYLVIVIVVAITQVFTGLNFRQLFFSHNKMNKHDRQKAKVRSLRCFLAYENFFFFFNCAFCVCMRNELPLYGICTYIIITRGAYSYDCLRRARAHLAKGDSNLLDKRVCSQRACCLYKAC